MSLRRTRLIPSQNREFYPSQPFTTLHDPSLKLCFISLGRNSFDSQTRETFTPSPRFTEKSNQINYYEYVKGVKGTLKRYINNEKGGIYTYYRSLPHLDPSVLHSRTLGHPATAYNRFGARSAQ